MQHTFEAVIFDLDGTLIDSMWVWPEIDKAYLGKFNLVPPPNMEDELEGMSFTETADYFKNRFKLSCTVDEIKQSWNEMAWTFYTDRVTLKEGAYSFLKCIKEKGLKTGIATSNSMELTEAILEKLRIKELFDSVRTSCEVEKGKPYPFIFLKVAEDLDVQPEKCLVLEDVPNGVLAAKRAGMSVWAIEDHQKDKVKKSLIEEADKYIYHYQEIIDLFK